MNTPLRAWHVWLPVAIGILALCLLCGCTTVNVLPEAEALEMATNVNQGE